mmetsp:Transcript_28368/g.61760  ORF Transcript_28368/g.61760 Transcript_28368/m.61760 type:complete len:89 (-) Transcript_28368:673-939(-)
MTRSPPSDAQLKSSTVGGKMAEKAEKKGLLVSAVFADATLRPVVLSKLSADDAAIRGRLRSELSRPPSISASIHRHLLLPRIVPPASL